MSSVITHHSSKPREQKNRELWSTLTRTGRAQVDNVTNQLIVLFTEVQKSVHKLILTMLFTAHGPTQTRSVCFAFFYFIFSWKFQEYERKGTICCLLFFTERWQEIGYFKQNTCRLSTWYLYSVLASRAEMIANTSGHQSSALSEILIYVWLSLVTQLVQ